MGHAMVKEWVSSVQKHIGSNLRGDGGHDGYTPTFFPCQRGHLCTIPSILTSDFVSFFVLSLTHPPFQGDPTAYVRIYFHLHLSEDTSTR